MWSWSCSETTLRAAALTSSSVMARASEPLSCSAMNCVAGEGDEAGRIGMREAAAAAVKGMLLGCYPSMLKTLLLLTCPPIYMVTEHTN